MILATWLLSAVMAATLSAAQTLGDVAAAAQRERGERPAARILTDADLASKQPWQITPAGFRLYASIRADLTALRKERPALHVRLFDASRNVQRLAEMEPILAQESLVLKVLESYGVTPGDYLRMDQAILTAAYWSRFEPPAAVRQNGAYMSNIRFMWEQPRLVREETARYAGEQWYNDVRFVEHL